MDYPQIGHSSAARFSGARRAATISAICRACSTALVLLMLGFRSHAVAMPQCSDGIDNDSDGFTDLQDFNCFYSEDDTESATQCADGMDNDGDGFIDLEDFDCSGPEDSTEGITVIGVPTLSVIALMLLAFGVLVTARRS